MDKLAAFKFVPSAAAKTGRKSYPILAHTSSRQAASSLPKAGFASQFIGKQKSEIIVDSSSITSKQSKVSSDTDPDKLKIWHWNVNGLKLILKRKLLQKFLASYRPRILCLNETKMS